MIKYTICEMDSFSVIGQEIELTNFGNMERLKAHEALNLVEGILR